MAGTTRKEWLAKSGWKQINGFVPGEIDEQFRAYAEQNDLSLSAALRKAIIEMLEREGEIKPQSKGWKKP